MSNLIRYFGTSAILLFLSIFANAFRYDDVGETIPQQVEMKVGGSVNISCRINPTMFEGPCEMYFINELTEQRVPDDDILVINSTNIVYMLRNASVQSTSFRCSCGENGVMESNVYVGTPPRGVSQFQCRSYDFEYMNCNFTLPENPVFTQHNLSYYFNSPSYEMPAYCYFDMKPLVVCNITAEHAYRPQVEEYHFKVYSSNSLGSHMQEFHINNLNVMVPAAPGEDFRITKLTADSMEAIWSMPKYDFYTHNKHRGLQWEVLLQPAGFPVRNISAQVRVMRVDRGCKLILNKLPYAYYSYELRLRVKVRNAAASEVMWSPTFKHSFRTRPRTPDRPPRTGNGSFFLKPYENEVRLYWEQLELWEENGDNFTYIIRVLKTHPNGQSRVLLPRHQDVSFAVFEWQDNLHYTFDISSRNHMGESSTASRITIYPQTGRLANQYTPDAIHNAYHQTNRSYTLTWQPPSVRAGLQHYTVFWCYSKLANTNDCRGSIHFRHVSRETQRFSTKQQLAEHEHSLTLAVSANYLDYNTGMHWTSCSLDVNADFEPMLLEVHTISATALKVQWGSQNVCPSILSGYNLTYCEVANSPDIDNLLLPNNDITMYESFTYGKTVPAEKANCSVAPITVTIDKNLKKTNITGLKPYTIYHVEMFMFSTIKMGKPNEPLLVRTFESAPTAPRQLYVSHLSENSANISWLPPSQTNGHIRQYIVKLNNKEIFVNASEYVSVDEITIELKNLTSYTPYKVFVIAVTKYNSPHSNDIHFTTYMSAPFKIIDTHALNKDNGEAEVQWSAPSEPNGRLAYYEIAVTQLRGDYVERQRISIVFGTSCVLRVPVCPDHDYQTKVEVRAINAGSIANNEVNPDAIRPYDGQIEHYDLNYEDRDDLACTVAAEAVTTIERQRMLLMSYHKKDEYILYKSDWYSVTNFMCGQRQLAKIAGVTLMVVCTSLLLMTLMFFGTKKLKMMRSIECKLPAALDAYLSKEPSCNGGGHGGGATTNRGDVGGIFVNEFLKSTAVRNGGAMARHNEERHLLGAQKNDSGYIGDGLLFGRSISAVATTATADNDDSGEEDVPHREREYLNSESSADSLMGSTNSSGGGDSASGELQDVVANVAPLKRIAEEPSSQLQSAITEAVPSPAMGGYVTAADFSAWTHTKVPTETATVPHSNNLGAAAGKNDYIDINALAGNTTFSGYITPTDLTSWTQPPPTTKTTTKATEQACHSGYIKPNDLQTSNDSPQHSGVLTNVHDANIKSDYIKASDLSKISGVWPNQQPSSMAVATNNSGYITVDSLTTAIPPKPLLSASVVEETAPTANAVNSPSCGYVQPSTLQKMLFSPTMATDAKTVNSPPANTNFSGYTTLEAFGKLTSAQGARSVNAPPEQASGKAGLIGYVTQREMNEFGQQQQQELQ